METIICETMDCKIDSRQGKAQISKGQKSETAMVHRNKM